MQSELFHETIEDAQGADIIASGGYKHVARTLFPNKTLHGGYAYLKNCLRDDRNEKLGPEDLFGLIRLAAEADSFCTINFICDGSFLTRPDRIDPEVERAQLIGQADDLTATLGNLVSRLERLK